MSQAGRGVMTRSLTLIDELVLTLLNEESGYFRQVPGWNLNCAVVGAALAELSLMARIDTDMESLILLDGTATGDPALDPVLYKIASEADQRNAQYWIERLAPEAESVIDLTLARLCDLKILQHHDGDFWSLAGSAWRMGVHTGSEVGTAVEFVKTRISRAIFNNEIPDPRDIVIIGLIHTCDVLRFIFELDEESEERVEQICKMDLIGRAIADAVGHNIAGPLFRRSALTKQIPVAKLRTMLGSKHLRTGQHTPRSFAGARRGVRPGVPDPAALQGAHDLHCRARDQSLGPSARSHVPEWARDYFEDMEKVYGGVGLLPGLDGADHFRYRKSVQSGYSRTRLEERLDEVYSYARSHMATWAVGQEFRAVRECRLLVNSQISPLSVSIESQDIVEDLQAFKERALKAYLAKTMPRFMLKTPGMKRRARLIDEVVDRVQSGHTPAQRAGCPRDLADDLLSIHSNDRQFLPESNLRFVLSTPLLASMYVGDELSFIVHAMLSQPEFHDMIRAEADAVFADGDPDHKTLTGPATDVTRRFIMECLRLWPTVPMSVRNVMNACMVEGYELPEGVRVHIATTATHYMKDLFPDPFKFDIDRYAEPRKEHLGSSYAPVRPRHAHVSRRPDGRDADGDEPAADRPPFHT